MNDDVFDKVKIGLMQAINGLLVVEKNLSEDVEQDKFEEREHESLARLVMTINLTRMNIENMEKVINFIFELKKH
jgi:hypothetical protein